MATGPENAPRSFDENVAAVIRVLMAMQDIDVLDLAPRVGMTKSTFYNRMSGRGWLAAELDRLAAYFKVSPVLFFRPVEQAIATQNWKKLSAPDLRVLHGGGTDKLDESDRSRRHLVSVRADDT